jgi:uncharacterized protein YkwD
MTDAHHSGRHRGKRRGRLGPVVSAVAVLVATAPAAWFMTHNGGSDSLADAPTELQSSYDDRQPARPGEPEYDDSAPATGSDVHIGDPQTPSTGRGPQPGGRPTSPRRTPAKPTPSTTSSTATASPTPTRTDKPSRSEPSRTPRPTVTPTQSRPTSPASTSVPTQQPQPGGASPEESEVLRLTNAERAKHGCGPLTADPNLLVSAGGHAEDMVDRHFFDHTNPDGEDPFERMRDAGFHGSSMAENIAMGYSSAKAVVAGWMDSSGHRRNILNCDYNRLGVGYDPGQIEEGYASGSWVQNFGRR